MSLAICSSSQVCASMRRVESRACSLPASSQYPARHLPFSAQGIAVSDLVNTVPGQSRDVLIHGNRVANVPQWKGGIDTPGGLRVSVIGN